MPRQEHQAPGLATVVIDTDDNGEPLLTISLDPQYRGDLNDLATANDHPDGVYLQCDSVSAIDNPKLAKFMEELKLYDHDRDGRYDGDHIIQAIEDALYRSTEEPLRFHRPAGGLYTRLLMKLMPPQPERPIVFGFGELRERFRFVHYVLALPTILAIIALIDLQVRLLPWSKHSVVSGFMEITKWLGLSWWLTLIVFTLAIVILSRKGQNSSLPSHSKHTYGFFNKAAVYEEQAFREGAERWNWWQRTVSCVVFGAIHMVNLIYPLATILPLSLGGALFMWVYLKNFRQTHSRRSAVLAAAVVHRVYNRLALIALGIWLVWFFGSLALGMLAVFMTLVLTVLATNWQSARRLRQQTLTAAPEMA